MEQDRTVFQLTPNPLVLSMFSWVLRDWGERKSHKQTAVPNPLRVALEA